MIFWFDSQSRYNSNNNLFETLYCYTCIDFIHVLRPAEHLSRRDMTEWSKVLA